MSKTQQRPRIVASLKARGFDKSRAIPFARGARVGCSQCEALVINGIACHERGCPNDIRLARCWVCGFDAPEGSSCCNDEVQA